MRTVRKRSPDINMIPYIDVLLVLLLIFMLSTTQQIESMNLSLPALKSSKVTKKITKAISIDQFKTVTVENRSVGKIHEINSNILRKSLTKDDDVAIYAHQTLPYSDVMQMLHIIKSMGIEKIDLAYAST